MDLRTIPLNVGCIHRMNRKTESFLSAEPKLELEPYNTPVKSNLEFLFNYVNLN